jgi:hypothetical protein
MSSRRVAWLLAGGVAVIAFAIWLSSRRHLERATLAGDLVLPGLEHTINAVTQVELRKGDGTHATMKEDSAGWIVGERGWPADINKVRKLLLDLGALNVVEEKTRLPANYPQLGVEDVGSPSATGTRVDIVAPAHSWALIVGKTSSAKSGYVRVVSAPQSFLAAPLLTLDADPRTWLEHALIDLRADRVRQVEEKPADGTGFSASRLRKAEGNFTVTPLPRGRQLAGPGAADAIAGALSGLLLDDAQKATARTAARASHALFRTFDGLEVEVAGHKEGTRTVVAISARSAGKDSAAEAQKLNGRLEGWEFDVPDYKYAAIFTPLEQLLKNPPESAPRKSAAKPAATAAPK